MEKNSSSITEDARPLKYELAKNTRFDPKLLPAIQNLRALGFKLGDIGMILGYAGKNSRDLLKNLAQTNEDVNNALAIGKDMSKTYMIEQMYRSACGYEYDEVEKTFENRFNETRFLTFDKTICIPSNILFYSISVDNNGGIYQCPNL